ncbi:uncharacterized protein PITG_12051 [Phytophthora infestans T30-4]|uniref:Uncharacterized protein n=2 Tax=Phytophthora infestans TaxID=4787 RepID=D0NHT3_PHYIT|nr:uncharacterized protein PITG_12051 [Phytophthora infestans T30-4]EEY59008.1 conserved hypothetical protein [Phytophthora infestans T30-4]|eukprot:XP_002901481.1 conserved hypothetical protein [Phytophthora infestans T30-4]
MTHPQHLQRYHQQQRQEQQERKESTQQPRDYIDVLLESAGLDETLPSQTSTTLPSESWHYPPSQNGQSNSGSTGSYSFMAQQQQGQHLQLSPTGELPHNPNLRF